VSKSQEIRISNRKKMDLFEKDEFIAKRKGKAEKRKEK